MNKMSVVVGLLLINSWAYAQSDPTVPPSGQTTPPGVSVGASSGASTGVSPGASSSATLNCHYHIGPEITKIETSTLATWAGNAAVQSFEFNPATMDDQLTALKSCYTEQGWQGFSDALQKSGNVSAIKSQHLMVSSQVEGDVQVSAVKDNQWKVTVPLQVVYQNEKEKLTQPLVVLLLIGRKPSGDLGIMQMIASPKEATGTSNSLAPGRAAPATFSGQATPGVGTSPRVNPTPPGQTHVQ